MKNPFEEEILCTHTFSPNWYKQQCLLFFHHTVFYASNYILYEYDIYEKRIVRDACFRKLALNCGMDAKNIKIHAITLLTKPMIVIGTNQPYIVFFNFDTWMPINILKLHQVNIKSISSLVCPATPTAMNQKISIVLTDQLNQCHKINLQPTYKLLSHLPLLNKQKIKTQHILHQNLSLIITMKNSIKFYNQFFHQQIPFQSNFISQDLNQEYCLATDVIKRGQNIEITILSRNKANLYFLNYYKFAEEKKEVIKVIENVRIQLKITYPKAMIEKLKKYQKCAMTVKNVFDGKEVSVLVTGKLGQIFTIHIEKLGKEVPKMINIKPHSIENNPNYLSIWDDSKHYREIYAIYEHDQKLYMASTDQSLSIWALLQNKLPKHIYSIKFVTAETQQFFFSQIQPAVIYILLRDSVIRSMAPLGDGSRFLNQYWKYTKKFNKITKASAHLCEEGIVALATKCNKVLIYDLYEDRLMRFIEINNEEVINLTFQYVTIKDSIEKLNFSSLSEERKQLNKWTEIPIKVNKYFVKEEKQDIGLLIQQCNSLILIFKQKGQQNDFKAIQIPRFYRIERVHFCKLWNGQSLLATHSKNNILHINILLKGKYLNLKINHNFGGRFTYKLSFTNVLSIIEYKNKKLWFGQYSLEEDGTVIERISCDLSSRMMISAQQFILDYHSKKGAFYNKKDDMVGILDFQDIHNFKIEFYELSSKIESLAFYHKNYLVIGFKDQSIKVLKIDTLPRMAEGGWHPNKKIKKDVIIANTEKIEENNCMEEQKMKEGGNEIKGGDEEDWISDDENI